MDWNINSSITGIQWPALPTPVATARLAALFQIEQSQWWSQEKLRQHQFAQLRPLLKHSAQYVPYYKDKLKDLFSSDGLSEEEIGRAHV